MQSVHIEAQGRRQGHGPARPAGQGDLLQQPGKSPGRGAPSRIGNDDTAVSFIVADGQLYIKKDGETDTPRSARRPRSPDPAIILDRERSLVN